MLKNIKTTKGQELYFAAAEGDCEYAVIKEGGGVFTAIFSANKEEVWKEVCADAQETMFKMAQCIVVEFAGAQDFTTTKGRIEKMFSVETFVA